MTDVCYEHELCDMEPCTQQDREQDTPTRGEARQQRVDNGRKMRVSGRSTLLLGALSAGQQRRRVSRRKRGA